MAKIKYMDEKNITLGFKILGADIVTAITMIIPIGIIMWLIKIQEMTVLGIALGVGVFFLYYHNRGFWARKIFNIRS